MTVSTTTDPDASLEEPAPAPDGVLAGPPLLVWLLTALHVMLLVCYSVLVPTWRGPDEHNHVDLVVALTEDGGYPAYDQRVLDPGIRAALGQVRFKDRSRNLLRGEALPRAARPARSDLDDVGRDIELGTEFERKGRLNHMSQHPPGYYVYLAVSSVVTDTLAPGTGLGSYDREVATLRLLSLLLLAPLPLLAWASARVAGASEATAVGAAVVPIGVPQLTHIGSVVNNDALLLLLMGVLTLMAVRFATGRVGLRRAVLAGVLTGLALLVKGFAFVVPVWLLVAIVWGCRRGIRRPLPLLAAYVGATFVAGGWWWVGNLIRYGQIQPSLEYVRRLSEAPPSAERDLSGWLADWLPNMSERFWGSFGWVEIPLPDRWTTTATAVVLVAVVAAVVKRRPPLSGAVTMALLLPTVLLGGFVFFSGLRLYRMSTVAAMVQGRYLFGGIVGLSVLVAVGLGHLLARRAPLLPAVLLMGAAAMHLRSVATLLDAFWGEPGAGMAPSLAAAAAWSAWPPWVLAAAVAVGGATVVATGIGAVRFAGLGRRRAAS